MKFLKEKKLNIICSIVSVAIMIAVWIIAYYSVRNDYLIPSFSQTVKEFFTSFARGEFWLALLNTFLRTIVAFLVSFLSAVLCAVLSASSKVFKLILNPFIALLRTLPTLAVILLILIWSNANIAPVIVTVLVLFPMIYAQFLAAFNGIDKNLIEMAEVYDIDRRDKIFKIYLPLISPNIFANTGANISFGLKVMISAEVLANTYRSLGGLMQDARAYLEMPRLAALTLAAVVLGFILDAALSQLTRINGRWFKGADK